MNGTVLLKIQNLIMQSGEDSEALETMVRGQYLEKGDTVYLLYEEEDLENHSTTTTKIKRCANGVVELKRMSTNATYQMLFDQEHEYEFPCTTPFGVLDMRVRTDMIEYQKTRECPFRLCISYEMFCQEASVGSNYLAITVLGT